MARSRSRTHFILRHFESEKEVFSWRSLPPFDGFIVNIQYDRAPYIAEVAKMVASGKKYFRYYSSIDYQFSLTNFGGASPPDEATYFNWVRDNVQFNGSTSFKRLRVSGDVGLFAFYLSGAERRELIPWKDVTGSLMQSLAQKMVDLAGAPGGTTIPCAGIFLDQAWLAHESWMYATNNASGHGDTKESQPGLNPLSFASGSTNYGTPSSTWTDHTTAIQNFIFELQARMAVLNPAAIVLANGDRKTVNSTTVPKPWLVENAWNSYADHVTAGGDGPRWAAAQVNWLSDSRNVLSLVAFGAANGATGFPEAFALWKANGGWISFTNDSTVSAVINRESAYVDAAMIQGGHY